MCITLTDQLKCLPDLPVILTDIYIFSISKSYYPQLCWTRLQRLDRNWIQGPAHSGNECAVERCDVDLSRHWNRSRERETRIWIEYDIQHYDVYEKEMNINYYD